DVLLKVWRRALGRLEGEEAGAGAAVEAPQKERQGSAQVSEREPRAREGVEHAPKNDAQGMRAGLERPFPGRPPQPLVAVQYRSRRDGVGRMQIDECVQSLRALPERIERAIIQISAIGVAVDHGAAKFELAH